MLIWQLFKENNKESDDKKNNGFITGMLLQFINPKVILYGKKEFE
jgi:cysteine/O-acetylserine efflux protein